MLQILLGEPIPEAGLTPLEFVKMDRPPTRQVYVKVLVRYHCCGAEKVVTLDNIARRSTNRSQLCRACQLAWMRTQTEGFAVKGELEDWGVQPPEWPVPSSVFAARRRLIFQPSTTRTRQ